MKRQYLGDEKDAFKWDYHDVLTRELGCTQLTMMLMMNEPDHKLGEGKTLPEKFKCARPEIIEFCGELKQNKDINHLRELPQKTDGKYAVALHEDNSVFNDGANRRAYFDGFSAQEDAEVVFIDPDIGFEPKSCTKKHLRYSEVSKVLSRISDNSVVSVFQYFQLGRLGQKDAFPRHFEEIKSRVENAHCAALYWDGKVMFVQIAKNAKIIERVKLINKEYAAPCCLVETISTA